MMLNLFLGFGWTVYIEVSIV